MATQSDEESITLQTYPLPKWMENCLQKELWKRCGPKGGSSDFDLAVYFKYYSRQCQRYALDGGIHMSAKTHNHLLTIADIVLQDIQKAAAFEELKKWEPHSNAVESCLNKSVHLCAALLLMMEVGDQRFGFSGSYPLKWHSSQSLREAVCQHFENARGRIIQPDNQRTGKLFTAHNLKHIGGMEIRWTDNLVDHLLLKDDGLTVSIFHYASFLKFQQGQVPQAKSLFYRIIPSSSFLLRPAEIPRSSCSPSSFRLTEHRINAIERSGQRSYPH